MASPSSPSGFWGRVRLGLGYALGDLFEDLALWLVAGVVLAGAIGALVPTGFLEQHLGSGLLPKLVMLGVGIPLYVCATASTPIVAALAVKGLSPGAALVFLLAGPVTNAASLTVLTRLLGRRTVAVYLAVIAVASLLLGVATDWLYGFLGRDVGHWLATTAPETHGSLQLACALALLVLTARVVWRRRQDRHTCVPQA